MPIPTRTDALLSEIENLGAAVRVALTVLRHNPANDGRAVRECLQTYCDKVIDAANEIIANADARQGDL
jgi:hypothetical protein